MQFTLTDRSAAEIPARAGDHARSLHASSSLAQFETNTSLISGNDSHPITTVNDYPSYAQEPSSLDRNRYFTVAYALSIFLGGIFAGDRGSAFRLCRIVGAIADIEGPGKNGGWPVAKSVFRSLGMKPTELDQRWAAVEVDSRLLPPEVLGAFVPPRLWAALNEIVEAGPFEAWERGRAVLRAWAKGRELAGGPRRSHAHRKSTLDHGGLSEGTINTMMTAFFGFMRALDQVRVLNQNGKLEMLEDASSLTRWNKADFPKQPSARDLGATPADTNRDAPSLRLIRLLLQMLCDEIETLKQAPSGRRSLFVLLRDRAMIGILVVTGLRRGALNRLKTGDLVEDYLFPDGISGPAIVPRPGKSLSLELKRPKGIPRVLFEWIKEYAEYAGIWDEEDCPLWLPNNAKRRALRHPLDDDSIYQAVRARFTPKPQRRGSGPEASLLSIAFFQEHDGRTYGPHQLRHAAEQIGFIVGLDWLEENRTTLLQNGAGLPSNPQVFPDALLDHSMSSLGERYKDVASERGRLKWARECALGIGEYIFGERGARRGPDLDLIAEKEAALEHAEARRTEVEVQLDTLEERIINQGETLDLKDILLGSVQMGRFARQLVALAEATERGRTELAEARKVEVAVPDYLTNAELEALRENRTALVVAPEYDDQEEIPVLREWASLDEFHWALGGQTAISIETLRRWARGEKTRLASALGLPEGTKGIDGGRPACVERLSDRKQRILLNRLDWSRLPTQVQENLEAIRRLPADAPSPALVAAGA